MDAGRPEHAVQTVSQSSAEKAANSVLELMNPTVRHDRYPRFIPLQLNAAAPDDDAEQPAAEVQQALHFNWLNVVHELEEFFEANPDLVEYADAPEQAVQVHEANEHPNEELAFDAPDPRAPVVVQHVHDVQYDTAEPTASSSSRTSATPSPPSSRTSSSSEAPSTPSSFSSTTVEPSSSPPTPLTPWSTDSLPPSFNQSESIPSPPTPPPAHLPPTHRRGIGKGHGHPDRRGVVWTTPSAERVMTYAVPAEARYEEKSGAGKGRGCFVALRRWVDDCFGW